jgi:hypothetical protein
LDRIWIRYRSSRPADAAVCARLRELAAVCRRFGYRRLIVLMRREGLTTGREVAEFGQWCCVCPLQQYCDCRRIGGYAATSWS